MVFTCRRELGLASEKHRTTTSDLQAQPAVGGRLVGPSQPPRSSGARPRGSAGDPGHSCPRLRAAAPRGSGLVLLARAARPGVPGCPLPLPLLGWARPWHSRTGLALAPIAGPAGLGQAGTGVQRLGGPQDAGGAPPHPRGVGTWDPQAAAQGISQPLSGFPPAEAASRGCSSGRAQYHAGGSATGNPPAYRRLQPPPRPQPPAALGEPAGGCSWARTPPLPPGLLVFSRAAETWLQACLECGPRRPDQDRRLPASGLGPRRELGLRREVQGGGGRATPGLHWAQPGCTACPHLRGRSASARRLQEQDRAREAGREWGAERRDREAGPRGPSSTGEPGVRGLTGRRRSAGPCGGPRRCPRGAGRR